MPARTVSAGMAFGGLARSRHPKSGMPQERTFQVKVRSGAMGQQQTSANSHCLDLRAQKERPPHAAVLPKSELMFLYGGCDSVLPLPAPAKQTHCAEAGGEERESGGQGRSTNGSEAFIADGD